jgi:retron-type reverse transcriptase
MTKSKKAIDDWKALPWKKFQKTVFRLQIRIFKARKKSDHKRVRQLQKLLLNSKAAKYLAVRQVTQLNQGKSTAGVDGKTALNCKERMQLAEQLTSGWKSWKHQKLRRVSIPKKDGTQRKLGIPTIGDRAYQCLLKHALEPAAEATFHENSYGFVRLVGAAERVGTLSAAPHLQEGYVLKKEVKREGRKPETEITQLS